MFPRLEARTERAPRSQQQAAGAGSSAPVAPAPATPAGARLRRAADLLLALVSLDALSLPLRDSTVPAHPHRRPAGVDLPARRAGMPPRPDQVCVTPRLQARRLRDGSATR